MNEWSLFSTELQFNIKLKAKWQRTCHQKEMKASQTLQTTDDPTVKECTGHKSDILFFASFVFHTSALNSPFICCQTALPYTSNMVSSTWKGKHHYCMADSHKSWQAQRKAGNFPLCVVLAPFHPQLWWARLKELQVCPTNDFLICLNLGGKCHVKL